MSIETRLAFIKTTLTRQHTLDLTSAISSVHNRYKLNPPLSEKQVESFEHQHQIVLPEEYREFLLRVGNGGAGPDYGLEPLERSGRHLNKTFPHTECWSPHGQEIWPSVNIIEGRTFDDEDNFERLWDGALEIGSAGCDFKNLLVITGPERGSMWLSEMDNGIGFLPYSGLEDNPKSQQMFPTYHLGGAGRIGFLDWYEHWLRISLMRLA